MAKLIYETDAGHKIAVEIAESLITELEYSHQIDAWAEILAIFKQEIIASNKLMEDNNG